MNPVPVLETKKLSKYFSGIAANKKIDFQLKKGEIHVLLGENGAGKSTLMNVISGLHRADEGTIHINGKQVQIKNPREAISLGIGMIHQHFMLVPGFTVTENIILGNEITRGPFLDMSKANDRIASLSKAYGLELDPKALTENLPVGVQQKIEILKALYRNASILILDEPTAVLTPAETDELFKTKKQLKKNGVSIVFITHKLKEVLDIADRITIIRHGRIVGSTTAKESNEKDLAKMMVGRNVTLSASGKPAKPGKTLLKFHNLTVYDDRGVKTVSDLSLSLRAGEIVGIAGVQGNGQTELAEALTGLRRIKGGKISIAGKMIPDKKLKPKYLIANGMGHIPEDRQKHGLVLPFSIADNQVLSLYNKNPFAKFGHRIKKALMNNAERLIDQFDIRAKSPEDSVATLSGGNQQKVIISRELSRNLKILVSNQPSRGLDVGAIEYIHNCLLKLRDQGAAILLISSELEEILTLSDRIIVMYQGEFILEVKKNDATRKDLGLAMGGVT